MTITLIKEAIQNEFEIAESTRLILNLDDNTVRINDKGPYWIMERD